MTTTRRIIGTAAACALALCAAASPAAAQEPPDVPTVPEAVDMTFETARWAVDESSRAPETAIETGRDVTNQAFATAETVIRELLIVGPSPDVMGEACFVLGVPSENCPQL